MRDKDSIGLVSVELPVWLPAGVHPAATVQIGAFTYSRSRIGRAVARIGRYCSIASDVTFGEREHPTDWISTSSFTYDGDMRMFAEAAVNTPFVPMSLPPGRSHEPIGIGHDVWVGARVYIRRGVNVGNGAILGANAVVTNDVPPYAIVVGNPGRIVKYRFDEGTVARLQAVEWWRYKFTDFAGLDLSDPTEVLDRIETLSLDPYEPGLSTLKQSAADQRDVP